MDIDQKKFLYQFPKSFKPVVEELLKRGYIVTLVGGSVRDFFLFGKLGHDWDFEISHNTLPFNKSEWKELGKSLSQNRKLSFLPYDIIRLDFDSLQMELSPPRIEHYREDLKGHSNFDAEFDFKLPFEEAVKRRDFSINAMGIRFHALDKIELLDPLNGLKHLKEKMLYPAGGDFAKDPVRFLRAFRFALKYKLSISEELYKEFDSMDLSAISPMYLWNEMQKSGDPLSYLGELLKIKEKYSSLRLPLEVSTEKLKEIRNVLSDFKKHEAWIIALEWSNVKSESWSQFFNVSSESCRRLGRWAQTSKKFQDILPETFQGEFEDVRESDNFEMLFDWYFTTKNLLQKNPDLPLMKMIGDYLPHWSYLYKFEAPKDVKHIDPPFRAKYQVWNLCQRI